MELLFGPRGRHHQSVHPLVKSTASVAQPTTEVWLIPISRSDGGYVEL
jgi:hypothetical protein